jgi:hypothetical protein
LDAQALEHLAQTVGSLMQLRIGVQARPLTRPVLTQSHSARRIWRCSPTAATHLGHVEMAVHMPAKLRMKCGITVAMILLVTVSHCFPPYDRKYVPRKKNFQ